MPSAGMCSHASVDASGVCCEPYVFDLCYLGVAAVAAEALHADDLLVPRRRDEAMPRGTTSDLIMQLDWPCEVAQCDGSRVQKRWYWDDWALSGDALPCGMQMHWRRDAASCSGCGCRIRSHRVEGTLAGCFRSRQREFRPRVLTGFGCGDQRRYRPDDSTLWRISVASQRYVSTVVRPRPVPSVYSARRYATYEPSLYYYTEAASMDTHCTKVLSTSRGTRGDHVGENMMGMVPGPGDAIRSDLACDFVSGALGSHLHDISGHDEAWTLVPARLESSASGRAFCLHMRASPPQEDHDSKAAPVHNLCAARSARGGYPISLANCIAVCATATSLLAWPSCVHTETHERGMSGPNATRIVFSARVIGGSRCPPVRWGPARGDRTVGYTELPDPAAHLACVGRGGDSIQHHRRGLDFVTHTTVLLRRTRKAHHVRNGAIGAARGNDPAVVDNSGIDARCIAPRDPYSLHLHRRLHVTPVGDACDASGAALVSAPSAQTPPLGCAPGQGQARSYCDRPDVDATDRDVRDRVEQASIEEGRSSDRNGHGPPSTRHPLLLPSHSRALPSDHHRGPGHPDSRTPALVPRPTSGITSAPWSSGSGVPLQEVVMYGDADPTEEGTNEISARLGHLHVRTRARTEQRKERSKWRRDISNDWATTYGDITIDADGDASAGADDAGGTLTVVDADADADVDGGDDSSARSDGSTLPTLPPAPYPEGRDSDEGQGNGGERHAEGEECSVRGYHEGQRRNGRSPRHASIEHAKHTAVADGGWDGGPRHGGDHPHRQHGWRHPPPIMFLFSLSSVSVTRTVEFQLVVIDGTLPPLPTTRRTDVTVTLTLNSLTTVVTDIVTA